MSKIVTDKFRCDLARCPIQIKTPITPVTAKHGNDNSDIPKKGSLELCDRQNRIRQICQALKLPKQELPEQALPKK